jgi:Fic family protein
MKSEAFKQGATGRLVATIDGCCAFIPDPLPPQRSLDLQPLVMRLVAASQALGELSGMGSTMSNPYLLVRPLLRREAVASSRIEGTVASIEQLVLFEAGVDVANEAPDAGEVHNYVRALEHGIRRLHELPVCLRLMNELHAILLGGVRDHRGARVAPGEFRRTQNWIGARRIQDARYVAPPPQEVMPTLDALEKYIQSEQRDFPLLVRVALIHYQFEAIHPYPDGNGRVGRLLIPLILCERKALSQPLLYLSNYFERNRDEYIDLMLDISQVGSWERWIEFFVRGVEQECRDTIETIRSLQALRADFEQRIQRARSSVLLGKLIDLLFESPVVTVPHAARKLEISYNAAKNNLERLAQAKVVEPASRGSRNYWIAREILHVMAQETASER